MTLARPKSIREQAFAQVQKFLCAPRMSVGEERSNNLSGPHANLYGYDLPGINIWHRDEQDVIALTATMFNSAIARIAYAIENPDASLRWIDGEGFRLFGDNGDEEVLFKLGREDRA